jgi:hypothetical protein
MQECLPCCGGMHGDAWAMHADQVLRILHAPLKTRDNPPHLTTSFASR